MKNAAHAGDGEGWLAKRFHALRSSSPERDEMEAQEYWHRRFREHPEELADLKADNPHAPARVGEEPPPDARPGGAMRLTWRQLAVWINATFAVLQGIATLILFGLGASSDKIVLSICWTALWSLQAGLLFLRYG